MALTNEQLVAMEDAREKAGNEFLRDIARQEMKGLQSELRRHREFEISEAKAKIGGNFDVHTMHMLVDIQAKYRDLGLDD